MNIFQKISALFNMNTVKEWMYRDEHEDLTSEDRAYIDKIKRQNPFGLIVMLLGGASLTFGPTYIILPIVTILFCFITFGTFDRSREDNPWTFYIGFILSVIGLYMAIVGKTHQLIL